LYGNSVIVSSHLPTNVNIALGYETSCCRMRRADGMDLDLSSQDN